MKVIKPEELKDYCIIIEDMYLKWYYDRYSVVQGEMKWMEIAKGSRKNIYVGYVEVLDIIKNEQGDITGVKIEFIKGEYEVENPVLDFDSTKVKGSAKEGNYDVHRISNFTVYIARMDDRKKLGKEFETREHKRITDALDKLKDF